MNLRGIRAVINGTAAISVGEGGKTVNSQGNTTFSLFAFSQSPVSTRLNAVDWLNADLTGTALIAVGDGGVILRSTDGGLTWSQRTSGTTKNLYGVWASTTTQIWAVGEAGTILVSTDAGLTWSAQTSGIATDLRAVWAAQGDATNAWAVGLGGVILKTSNGGTTWPAQTSNTTKDLYSVHGRTTASVWACGQDGQISFFNGVSWAGQTSGIAAGTILRSIYLATANIGFSVGDNGAVVHSVNGGTAWTVLTAPTPNTLYGVCCVDSSGTTWLVCGNGLTIYQYIAGTSATPPVIPGAVAVQGGSMIGTGSGTGNFGGGSDLFNTDAQAAQTSRFSQKGFAG